MHRMGIEAREKREIASDHQPLNVMGIGVVNGFTNDCRKAVHFGLAVPEEGWKRYVMRQGSCDPHSPA